MQRGRNGDGGRPRGRPRGRSRGRPRSLYTLTRERTAEEIRRSQEAELLANERRRELRHERRMERLDLQLVQLEVQEQLLLQQIELHTNQNRNEGEADGQIPFDVGAVGEDLTNQVIRVEETFNEPIEGVGGDADRPE